ncbi:MAG: DNA methyltransferase, partial [bacterium]
MNKALLNELLQNYRIETLEQHLIYAFLNNSNLDYLANPILKCYFENFEINPKLYLDAETLKLTSLKELENYLELLIP